LNAGESAIRLPDGHVWLRLAQADWNDPLDPSYAKEHGGRWNSPGSFPVLYLNEDLRTARLQLQELFADWPVNVEDLDQEAPYVLLLATLPRHQEVADAISSHGLGALGLPLSYPVDAHGRVISQRRCRSIGAAIFDAGLKGVWCRSVKTTDGSGHELAWFPRGRAKATMLRKPLPFSAWWFADSLP
jgi:RES domain